MSLVHPLDPPLPMDLVLALDLGQVLLLVTSDGRH